MGLWRESAVIDQEVTNVHGIVDTAIKRMLAARVIDTDEKSFPASHVETSRRRKWKLCIGGRRNRV